MCNFGSHVEHQDGVCFTLQSVHMNRHSNGFRTGMVSLRSGEVEKIELFGGSQHTKLRNVSRNVSQITIFFRTII